MATHAVELYFDDQTEALVRRLWRLLADAGAEDSQHVLGLRPHLSLTVAEGVDTDGMREVLAEWAARTEPFAVTLSSIGVFPGERGVVFLAPTPRARLLQVHADFQVAFAGFLGKQQAWYRPDRWVPHVTLAHVGGAARAGRVLATSWDQALPIEGRVVQVGLSKIRPSVLRYLFPLEGSDEP
ncbi:MAG: 2'-5' RNA ligase family protein [Alphaproteobacteria bacterium]|nr:2'-5' RNA ligase family protein [Alphaproteobacteria bacterium]MCB9698560.1 2'-5' RNA ligase family protein [Alphaproteobacteria bacterium]